MQSARSRCLSGFSDSGGKGIVLAIGCHSDSQLANRYGQHGAQTIIDTCGTRVYMPGIADPEMLGDVSKLAGQFSQRARFQDHHSEHSTVTEAMVRELPDGYGLVLRGNASPVLAKLRRGWKLPEYRQARRQGRAWPRYLRTISLCGQRQSRARVDQDEHLHRRQLLPRLERRSKRYGLDHAHPDRNGAHCLRCQPRGKRDADRRLRRRFHPNRGSADHYVSPSAVISDPREEVTDYVRTKQFTPNTMLALRELINGIGTEMAQYHELKAVPQDKSATSATICTSSVKPCA